MCIVLISHACGQAGLALVSRVLSILIKVSFRTKREILVLEAIKRSLPEFTLSHSTLLMALSEVEGPVEGVEMTTYL
jgi:hypothetical protein